MLFAYRPFLLAPGLTGQLAVPISQVIAQKLSENGLTRSQIMTS